MTTQMTMPRRALLAVGCIVVTSALVVLAAAPLPAQERRFAETTTTLSSEDLPIGLRLSSFVGFAASLVDAKLAEGKPEHARFYFEKFGLTLSEEEMTALSALYGDFDESQGVRHMQELRKVQGDPEAVKKLGDSFLRERADFTGSVFGEWLSILRDHGHEIGPFVTRILEDYGFTKSFGGHVPSQAKLESRSKRFEAAFHQHYGEPLRLLVGELGSGGVR